MQRYFDDSNGALKLPNVRAWAAHTGNITSTMQGQI